MKKINNSEIYANPMCSQKSFEISLDAIPFIKKVRMKKIGELNNSKPKLIQ
jgi:hypothetical protein